MTDPAWELCQQRVETTLERIREDRTRASVRVAALLEVIEQRLLDPNLDVNELLRECGVRDRNISTRFSTELGLAPRAYILEARMELAGRMLVDSDLQVWRIATQVGYLEANSFSRAFKSWSGKSPSQFRQVAKTPPILEPEPESTSDEWVSRQDILRAIVGELSTEQAETLATQLYGLGDLVCAGYRQLNPRKGGMAMVESTMADNFWEWICGLPFESQVRAVRSQAPRYQTLGLFHRLCTVSVEAEDGMQALKRAMLAVEALNAQGERVGEQYLSFFARAFAILGNAERRLGRIDAAVFQMHTALVLIECAGDDAHPLVVAELLLHRSALAMAQEHYREAGEYLEQGYTIMRNIAERWVEQRRKQGASPEESKSRMSRK